MKINNQGQWIHFIGVGGVASGPLAKSLAAQGNKITGSVEKLFDPIKTYLEDSDVDIQQDYSYTNLLEGNVMPDLVIYGSGISTKNKEYLFAQKQNLPLMHFPEFLRHNLVTKESIVVTGTFGKTSITAMLTAIFKQGEKTINYMYGGLPTDGRDPIQFNQDAEYSIIEGDEYIASRADSQSKFFFYDAKYLIVNAIQWDHTDIFVNEAAYIDNFRKLLLSIPEKGMIFANIDDKNVEILLTDSNIKAKIIKFSANKLVNWGQEEGITIQILGDYNYANACVAAKFAQKFDIDIETIKKALSNFVGIKRRLEIRKKFTIKGNEIVIIDDFASSPPKVKGSLKSIKKAFPGYKITAIFEPNTGNRTTQALDGFKNAFDDADTVMLPKFTELIKSENYPVDEKILGKFLADLGVNVQSLKNNKEKSDTDLVIVFMSSAGMENYIKQSINA